MKIKTHKSETWRYDKKTKLWIPYRKRMFVYWFKFLQIAIVEKHKINSKMYRGWDIKNINQDTKFDDWWESHWIKLFSIKQIGDKSKFTLSTTRGKSHYINWCIKVGQNLHIGSYPKIARQINYPYGESNAYITKTFSRMKSDYNKMLKNVCKGQFP